MARALIDGYEVKGSGGVCRFGSCGCYPFWKLYTTGILLEEELAENGKQHCDPDPNCLGFAIDGSNPGRYQVFYSDGGSGTHPNTCGAVAITWSSNDCFPEFTCYAKEATAAATRNLTEATTVGTRALLSRRLSWTEGFSASYLFYFDCGLASGLVAGACIVVLIWFLFLRRKKRPDCKEEEDVILLEEGEAEFPGTLAMRLANLRAAEKQLSAALNAVVKETSRAEKVAKLNLVGLASADLHETKALPEKIMNIVTEEKLLQAAPQKYGQQGDVQPEQEQISTITQSPKEIDQEDMQQEDVQQEGENAATGFNMKDKKKQEEELAVESNAKETKKKKKAPVDQEDVQQEDEGIAAPSFVELAAESNAKEKKKKKKAPVDQEDVQLEEENIVSPTFAVVAAAAKFKRKKKKAPVAQEDVRQEDESAAAPPSEEPTAESNTNEKKKKKKAPVDQENVQQ